MKDKNFYITSVFKLDISDEIGGEFKVGRVNFISKKKLIRNSKKLFLNELIKNKPKDVFNEFFFDQSNCFAYIEYKDESIVDLKNLIEEAIQILSISLIPYMENGVFCQISSENINSESNYFISSSIPEKRMGGSRSNVSNRTLFLDKDWVKCNKFFFFYKLLKILYTKDSKLKINNKWLLTIKEVVKIIGKTIQSTDYKNGFLLNMIAFEMLLTDNEEKYSKVLPERVEAFIGWTEEWHDEKMHSLISVLYKLRCDIVHNGDFENIGIKEYFAIRDINFILLWNIIVHIKYFKSKKELIIFSEKIKAEKLLGLKKSTILPKSLKFMKRSQDNIGPINLHDYFANVLNKSPN
jgi:hypothetical protein